MKKLFEKDLEGRLDERGATDARDPTDERDPTFDKGPVYVLYKQDWEESERGWGVRPDGCLLHKDMADSKAFRESYWAGMPREVPDEYDRESGEPKLVVVPKELYDSVVESDNSIRLCQHSCWEFGL